jgi:hypothetical protein
MSELLGFSLLAEQLSNGIDFQDETVSSRLGAKIGAEVCLALDLRDAGLQHIIHDVRSRHGSF